MSATEVDAPQLKEGQVDVEHQERCIEMEDLGKNPAKQDLYAAFSDFSSRDEEWLANMNKRIRRKVDIHLLPWIVLMYMTNFLDRVYVRKHNAPPQMTCGC